MRDFRVKLQAVNPPPVIAHRGAGALLRPGKHPEALRHPPDGIRMAHPHYAFRRNIRKQQMLPHLQHGFSVFAGISGASDFSARHPGDQLRAVTDPENRHAEIQNPGIIMRRRRIIDAVWSAGKNNALIARLPDLPEADLCVRPDFGIYLQFTHPSRDQLIVLSAEIQHQNPVHRSPHPYFLWFFTLRSRRSFSARAPRDRPRRSPPRNGWASRNP